MTSVIDVDGLEVRVSRKRQKNMYVRVLSPDGRIVVTAPLHFADAEIAWFIREKRDLILRRRDEVRSRARSDGSGARQEGGRAGARGVSRDGADSTGGNGDAFDDGRTGWRDERGGRGAPSEKELAEWRAVVEAFVPALVERWAPAIGVKPGKLAYRNMVSRWGSCNVRTGRICINVQLAAFPPECLEYVVVHELCHLVEANHGPRFKALLDAHLPRWREADAILKRRGVRR